jgi:UDP:flavonoid glycosyltransferase YjiC (YdhE family)
VGDDLPPILFFNVNGSGMGHLNRCLAYARRLRGRARPVFFSLASAMELIHGMGFEGDYYVSHAWSASPTFGWNSELAVRFGLMLERVQPAAVVFDGTWPFQGLMAAVKAYRGKRPALVWSNRGLLKDGSKSVTTETALFDLVIEPGELGMPIIPADDGRTVRVPPVCLLEEAELLDRATARAELGLPAEGRQVLLSLGPGNLKDVGGIGQGLIRDFQRAGCGVVWAQSPISVRDVEVPPGVMPLRMYPLARCLRAFDAVAGAVGYNTACEVVQAGVPALLIPNTLLADDQVRRANLVAQVAPAVVSPCETDAERQAAVQALLRLEPRGLQGSGEVMDGATVAAERILAACR